MKGLTPIMLCFNRTSFQQQLKHWVLGMFKKLERLQSYILSTTTETIGQALNSSRSPSFNRTSFQQQLKQNVLYRLRDSLRLQSYILSTTTETLAHDVFYVFRVASIVHPFNNNWNFHNRLEQRAAGLCFNRTSFQQQLKRCFSCWIKAADGDASIVHPFNNNWNRSIRTGAPLRKASIVHPFNNNLNIRSGVSAVKTASFNRTSFQQQLKLCLNICALCSLRCFNRTSFQQQLKHSTLGPSLPPS